MRPRQAEAKAAGPVQPTPSLFIRVRFGDRAFIGPGKVQLLELIQAHGSISGAGRAMGMSYRRAWMIIEELNKAFASPLVEKQTGGSGGGGALLTELGKEVAERYRRIEREAAERAADDLDALAGHLSREPVPSGAGKEP
jgi:molybdate transport system regulatory protein